MHLSLHDTIASQLCSSGKSREETRSQSKTGFALMSCDRLIYVFSARTRRINDCRIVHAEYVCILKKLCCPDIQVL